ncbi:MAG: septal ring lytic transglycosylase RlpA family protein [Sphingomonas sp.]|uniref:septal ring lytic transglycosylase RlpA family protein n=1 Tax=Sphingomonas sp. TaxID=28214 RepID=UPI001AC7C679|nr:septal ring lytic transglycosylase RlpA family protein [Sphingomonas sp.]MBN8814761.1 septal ring lytic transglycosylase RlpA family protein [Sphingomonas sp.]
MPSNARLAFLTGLALAVPASAQDAPPQSDGPQATSDRSPDRYDEVGYATWYGAELSGNPTASGAPFDPKAFTAAHRTLPLGTYVEVTSLETGRTVLVLINDRGPFTPGLLIDLSQAAAQAIGISSRKPVRIRRVTPTPADQNALKNGRAAASILDTPPALLAGLRAKLTGNSAAANPKPPAGSSLRMPPPSLKPSPVAKESLTKSPPATVRPPVAVTGGYYVQVAAFGSRERADAVARGLGGAATPFNKLWRVRTGPYADAKSASRARDAAAARGYGDARVVRDD